MSENTQVAPIVILGIDNDPDLEYARRRAARRDQIAAGAMTLYHEQSTHPVPTPTKEDLFSAVTQRRIVDLITHNK